MNRKQQAYRNAGIYMGAFFLLLLLLRLDVRAIGADGTNVGLSHLNGAVHFITRSHPWIYAFTQLLGWVALVVAASFILLAVGVLIKKNLAVAAGDRVLVSGVRADDSVCFFL